LFTEAIVALDISEPSMYTVKLTLTNTHG
jgi:hypothetical protein